MANKVYLGNDGYIHHVYDGDQTYSILQKDVEQIVELLKQRRGEKKPAKVLGDHTKIGKADSSARKAASEAIKNGDYDKLALFGTNVFHTVAANLIILASGRSKKVKVFKTRSKAIIWLEK